MDRPIDRKVPAPCPHLRLAGDPNSYCFFADEDHRCCRWPARIPIPEAYQTGVCLTPAHRSCPRQKEKVDAWERPSALASARESVSQNRGGILWSGLAVVLALAAAWLWFTSSGPFASASAGLPTTPASASPGLPGTPASAASRPTGTRAPSAAVTPWAAAVLATATPDPARPTWTVGPIRTPLPTLTPWPTPTSTPVVMATPTRTSTAIPTRVPPTATPTPVPPTATPNVSAGPEPIAQGQAWQGSGLSLTCWGPAGWTSEDPSGTGNLVLGFTVANLGEVPLSFDVPARVFSLELSTGKQYPAWPSWKGVTSLRQFPPGTVADFQVAIQISRKEFEALPRNPDVSFYLVQARGFHAQLLQARWRQDTRGR